MIRPPDHSDPLVGQVLPSGLLVLERLESPREGPLYRARYSPTGPPVALMFLPLPRNPRDPSTVFPLSPRFWQQLRRACQVRHPNVASLLEVGETPDRRGYAAGEFLTGQLLSEVVSGQGPLPPAQAVGVCLQAAAGLQAAHRMGVAHGALSPHTILITPGEDDQPLVKLIGFDFSWYQSGSWADLGHGGDERYWSPERLAGSAPDELSDVFSLGAVLHFLLTGTPPRDGSAPGSMAQALRRVVDRALASPDQRYPTAAAFAEALSQAAKSPPTQDLPQHRRWVAASIVLVLVAAGLWLGWDRFGAKPDAARRVELGARVGESVVVPPPRSTSAINGQVTERQNRGAADSVGSRSKVLSPHAQRPWLTKKLFASLVSRILGSRSVETGAIPSSRVAGSAPRAPSAQSPRAEPPDSIAGSFVSPFRRSHPWAAHPKGRTYFPSSSALALASSDLIYFTNEQDARDSGRSRCTAPECGVDAP